MINLILFDFQLGKTKHHKSHHFDVCNDTSMMVGECKPGIGGEPLLGQKTKPRNTKFPAGEGANLPAWVAFDRQVWRKQDYFTLVPDRSSSSSRGLCRRGTN